MSEKILDSINYPKDLKKVPAEKLPVLCAELRNFLIESILQSGGHFGSNLGVVELTVALHKVFDAPKDKIIWDVGHQAYAHKVLTGRKDRIGTIRKKGGLTPFPKIEESEYDAFTVGHSSTSISAATGMAVAQSQKENPAKVVAVIGDGALTGGMAFEALNHAGHIKADMLVILNDNKMSISKNVGGMREYLTRLISSPSYVNFRNKGREIFEVLPTIRRILMRTEKQAKGMVMPGTLFEELGFEYYGPVDGHDVNLLTEVLSNLKEVKGPKFLHVITEKGKGHVPAEKDRETFHAVKPAEKNDEVKKGKAYTEIFSDWICEKAEKDERIEAITPAMCHGSGLIKFCEKFPKRCHDVGIAEQHAVTFAAGLATQNKKPVVAIYSTFLQRAYDQVIHDVAIPNLDVLLAIDRAGIVGPDGATHAGSFDLSFLRTVPNFVIMAPSDENECYAMLEAGYEHVGPVAVRYPRENGIGNYDEKKSEKIEIGKAEIIMEGKSASRRIAILSFGTLLKNCKKSAEQLEATLVDMRFVKPLDEKLLEELSKTHDYFVTVEDNAMMGGAGSAVNECVLNNKLDVKVKNIGLPDKFLGHGTREEILAEAGLDEEAILEAIKNFIA